MVQQRCIYENCATYFSTQSRGLLPYRCGLFAGSLRGLRQRQFCLRHARLVAIPFCSDHLGVDRDELATNGSVGVELTVENTGARDGVEIVQLYLDDPAASVTRPVVKLIGFARVSAAPGEKRRVRFEVPASVTSFIGPELTRIVEPGEIELRLGASSADIRLTASLTLVGPTLTVDHSRRRHCLVTIT